MSMSTPIPAVCSRPPAGWSCTRPVGHPGPCAAVPVDGADVPTGPCNVPAPSHLCLRAAGHRGPCAAVRNDDVIPDDHRARAAYWLTAEFWESRATPSAVIGPAPDLKPKASPLERRIGAFLAYVLTVCVAAVLIAGAIGAVRFLL